MKNATQGLDGAAKGDAGAERRKRDEEANDQGAGFRTRRTQDIKAGQRPQMSAGPRAGANACAER
eukprot:9136339-Pyramimonas_sp.AAC.1